MLCCSQKQTLRTCTSLQHALCYSKRSNSPILYMPPTSFAAIETDSPSINKAPTRFVGVKTDSTNLYKLYTRLAVHKTDSTNLYKFTTRFAVVETDSTNFYNPPTRFAVVKMVFIRTCTSLQQALWQSKRTLRSSIQASHTPCGTQN